MGLSSILSHVWTSASWAISSSVCFCSRGLCRWRSGGSVTLSNGTACRLDRMSTATLMKAVSSIRMITCTRRRREAWFALIAVIAALAVGPRASRADTVASLLGNFTINQYCGLNVGADSLQVHYVVVFGQLPALRELHNADTDGNGVTSQAERDACVGRLAPELADGLAVRLDGAAIPLRATRWSSSLPTEQGGFSLRVDVDFKAALPASAPGAQRHLEFDNHNYPGRMGWHEIVVASASAVSVYD